jgi:hypothetical protein
MPATFDWQYASRSAWAYAAACAGSSTGRVVSGSAPL